MSIKKTLISFAFWNALLTIIAVIILVFFEVKRPFIINQVVLLGVVIFACQGFIRSNKRSLTISEKKSLLWGMLAIDQTFEFLCTVLALLSFDKMRCLMLFIIFLIFIFTSLINLIVIFIGINYSERRAHAYVPQL